MKPNQLMEHFETLAEKLGLRIIQGKGDFNGGRCIIRQDKVIVLNEMKPIEQRLRILAQEFSIMNLEGIFVVPVLREYINQHSLIIPEMQ
ncbi:uncharacterized protein METZ01_LOCUS204225 [marine metagenome]|uniref:Uncharacterized protein n=1 Tax=marine metagenome TaxID=408172 RepID=A0A382EN59_9ZZZZ